MPSNLAPSLFTGHHSLLINSKKRIKISVFSIFEPDSSSLNYPCSDVQASILQSASLLNGLASFSCYQPPFHLFILTACTFHEYIREPETSYLLFPALVEVCMNTGALVGRPWGRIIRMRVKASRKNIQRGKSRGRPSHIRSQASLFLSVSTCN